MFYINIENGKINGGSELDNSRFWSEDYFQVEVSEEIYSAVIAESEKFKYDAETNTIVENPDYEAEQAEKERARLNALSMTRGDMFEAIILAFGKTKADIRSMIEAAEGLTDIERALYLNRFDEALDFYRGYPAVDLIGQMLGVSSAQLDKFFETKDYKALLTLIEESEE